MRVPRSAVHWWEESQLRVLVLSSLAIQVFLSIFSFRRMRALPGWFRFIMWLAYLGGDAVAIYALATLFNQHKAAGEDGGSNAMLLQVVWAPVLLLHLGGQDGITAYNIEDNELWSRHFLTAVSQVTVAIYVFCKTWPPGGGDKRLLQAAIVLFVTGVLKCFLKPWALKSASIYSLVSSPAAAAVKQKEGPGLYASTLEEYVNEAKRILTREETEEGEAQGERASASSITMEDEGRRPRCNDEEPAGTGTGRSSVRRATVAWIRAMLEWCNERGKIRQARLQRIREMFRGHNEPSKLFVDLPSPYSRRLSILEDFYGLTEERAYGSVRQGLGTAFLLLYTKLKTVHYEEFDDPDDTLGILKFDFFGMMQVSRMVLPWAAMGLFHHSHREAYNDIDVKITYVMLCCTAALEYYSFTFSFAVLKPTGEAREMWPEMLAQYSFIRYFARSRNHRKKMWVVSLLGCKDFLDQHWCMKSCFSSATISKLVLQYLKDGWKEKIEDTASYCRFNNHRSILISWSLRLSIKREKPLLFDDSVLLWHIATDFCFFTSSLSPEHRCAFTEVPPFIKPGETLGLIRWIIVLISWIIRVLLGWCSPVHKDSCQCSEELTSCKAILCRQMSNYMAYLLFVNPEMLLPGSRRYIFTAAHQELEAIFKDDNQPVALYNTTELTKIIISKLKSSSQATNSGTVIHEAWVLAQNLKSLGDEEMWKVIQGVWVEMLCYSASRCRGYLHAKALGKGGEFLSYVWLTLFHMGMETFTDKLQREEAAGNNAVTSTAPSTCERVTSTTTTGVGAPSTYSEVHTASASAGASSSTFEIYIA